jgi:putative component of toxin-antitoxin plasmid stabilization module
VIVILLNGGDKSSKSQQSKDIQKAREYLKDFKEKIK